MGCLANIFRMFAITESLVIKYILEIHPKGKNIHNNIKISKVLC
jgi:hypothetical protein